MGSSTARTVGSKVGSTVMDFYLPGVRTDIEKITGKDVDKPEDVIKIGLHVNSATGAISKAKATIAAGKNVANTVTGKINCLDAAADMTMEIKPSSSFGGTFVEKALPKSAQAALKSVDKSLLDLKPVQKGLGKMGVEVAEGEEGTIAVSAAEGELSAEATVAARALGRIPVLGIVISVAMEIPAVVDAFKEDKENKENNKENTNEGWKQVGRSTLNVVGVTAGSAIGAALLTPVLPPLGTFIGAALGAMAGKFIAEKLGNKIFGERKSKTTEPESNNPPLQPQNTNVVA